MVWSTPRELNPGLTNYCLLHFRCDAGIGFDLGAIIKDLVCRPCLCQLSYSRLWCANQASNLDLGD